MAWNDSEAPQSEIERLAISGWEPFNLLPSCTCTIGQGTVQRKYYLPLAMQRKDPVAPCMGGVERSWKRIGYMGRSSARSIMLLLESANKEFFFFFFSQRALRGKVVVHGTSQVHSRTIPPGLKTVDAKKKKKKKKRPKKFESKDQHKMGTNAMVQSRDVREQTCSEMQLEVEK